MVLLQVQEVRVVLLQVQIGGQVSSPSGTGGQGVLL